MNASQFDASPHMRYLLTVGMSRADYIRFLQQSQHHMRAAVKGFAVAGTTLLDAGNRLADVAKYFLQHAADEHNEDETCKADLRRLGAPQTATATQATRDMCRVLREQSLSRPYRIIADSLVVERIAATSGELFFKALAQNLNKDELKATQYLQLHNRVESDHAHDAECLMDAPFWTRAERAAIECACRESRRRFHDFLAQFVPKGAIK